MSSAIHQRLCRVEDNFHDAFLNGALALQNFFTAWATLHTDIQNQVDALDQETLDLAYSISSRISIMADVFVDVERSSETRRLELMHQIESTLADLRLDDIYTPGVIQDCPSPCPSYIGPAYSWLISNLHDPYPSSAVKNSLAHCSGASTKCISDWFQKARRRIGWTIISSQYFGGDRQATVDAAYRALVEEDSERPLDHDHAFAFVEMKVKAEGMYATRFRKGELAGSLNLVVKELASGDGTPLGQDYIVAAGKKRGRGGNIGPRKRQRTSASRVPSFPSPSPPSSTPELSPSPSSPSSLPSDSEDCDTGVISMGRKRRATSRLSSGDFSDAMVDNVSNTSHRPTKRSRKICVSTDVAPHLAASKETCPSFDHWSSPIDALPSISMPISPARPPRKRRLSDAGDEERPKRPRDMSSAPRVCQSVSAPHATFSAPGVSEQPEIDFSEWFSLPSEVTTGGLDASIPLDIELFNWPALGGSSSDSFSTDVSTLLQPSLESSDSFAPANMASSVPQFDFAYRRTVQFGEMPPAGPEATYPPQTISDASELRQFLESLHTHTSGVEPIPAPSTYDDFTSQAVDLSMLYFPPPAQSILSPIDILARAGATEVSSVSKEARLAELVREVAELRNELGVVA